MKIKKMKKAIAYTYHQRQISTVQALLFFITLFVEEKRIAGMQVTPLGYLNAEHAEAGLSHTFTLALDYRIFTSCLRQMSVR